MGRYSLKSSPMNINIPRLPGMLHSDWLHLHNCSQTEVFSCVSPSGMRIFFKVYQITGSHQSLPFFKWHGTSAFRTRMCGRMSLVPAKPTIPNGFCFPHHGYTIPERASLVKDFFYLSLSFVLANVKTSPDHHPVLSVVCQTI